MINLLNGAVLNEYFDEKFLDKYNIQQIFYSDSDNVF